MVLLCSGAVSAVAVEPSTAAIEPAAIGGTSQEVTEIAQCTIIDEPGRDVLTSDITNSGARHCIRIIASDVVLDGRGYILDARDVDQKTEAVAAGYTNPRIEDITGKNLVVTDWGQYPLKERNVRGRQSVLAPLISVAFLKQIVSNGRSYG